MLEKIIKSLENLLEVRANKIYGDQAIAEATKMYNDGWEALEDGIVVFTKGNKVALKKGNTVENYEMRDFRVDLISACADRIDPAARRTAKRVAPNKLLLKSSMAFSHRKSRREMDCGKPRERSCRRM